MLQAPIPASKNYASDYTDPTRWEALSPRADDIVVVTPPKSGTTWTQCILALLISGDPEVNAEPTTKSPWIDLNFSDNTEVMARLEAQEHRRHVKTHTPLDGIPVWPDLSYITVYRHPIDVYFSFLKHARNQKEEISKPFFPKEYFSEDPSDGFGIFLEGDYVEAASLQAIVNHYLSTLSREPSENLLRLHYADMLRDLSGAFNRIADHVGIEHSLELMAQLIDAATFDNMKANAHRFTPSAGTKMWKEDSDFFDSGTSNKWEGKLTDEDLSAYDVRISKLLTSEDRRWLEFGSQFT